MLESIQNFLNQTGFTQFMQEGNWKCLIMIGIAFVLAYLAIVKQYEPLLLLPIAFGMLLTNLPGADMFHEALFAEGHVDWAAFGDTSVAKGLLDYLYLGVKLGIYPCLIFLGVGAMTDFGPLIANPKSLCLALPAQLGIFVTFVGARLLNFTEAQSSSIGIIGGADGPTAIYVTSMLAPELLGPIARGGLFVYGAGAGDSAADYAPADHQKGAADPYGNAAAGQQNGKKFSFLL